MCLFVDDSHYNFYFFQTSQWEQPVKNIREETLDTHFKRNKDLCLNECLEIDKKEAL